MKDRYGRPLTSLRVSVTDDCDLNCFYCHREGCLGGNREMTAEEIGDIVRAGAEFGIRKIKLTGGEPLIREDIVDVVSAVAQSPIVDVSMATNGTKLAGLAKDLAGAGLSRVNISLDTLDPKNYEYITGVPKLDQVLDGIDAALDARLSPVKLNMLVLKGVNDAEVERMIEYSLGRGTVLQLIELLWTPDTAEIYEKFHVSLDLIERELKKRASSVKTRWLMQARREYVIDGGEVEVVNPMHNSEFCTHCTRLRLTPDGHLKPCLMRNDNLVDVLTPIRSGDGKAARKAFKEAVERREPFYKSSPKD